MSPHVATPLVAEPMARPHLRYLQLLARAASHIDAHLDAELDAQVLAQQAAMSRHHFHRTFHAYFGLTVGGYVGWRRLRRACELLATPGVPVLDVAQEVGFGSAQALAKAMRRELDTTPSAVRAGQPPDWNGYFRRRRIADDAPAPDEPPPSMHPRWADAPAFDALCATGQGMRGGTMEQAAAEAFATLLQDLNASALEAQVTHLMASMPEEPQGPEDPHCRIWCGAIFGVSLTHGHGQTFRPPIALHARKHLHWQHWPAGRYAVFTHVGPYSGLHSQWKAIYRHWLPATGYRPRDVPGFEAYLNDPRVTPAAQLRTELYLPLE